MPRPTRVAASLPYGPGVGVPGVHVKRRHTGTEAPDDAGRSAQYPARRRPADLARRQRNHVRAVDGRLAGQSARRASLADQHRRHRAAAALERAGASAECAMVARQLHDRIPLGRQRLRDAGAMEECRARSRRERASRTSRGIPTARTFIFSPSMPRATPNASASACAATSSCSMKHGRGTCGGWP